MLKHLLTRKAVVLNEVDTGTDRYNSEVRTFVNTSGQEWDCRVDADRSEEVEVDRDTRRTWFRLVLSEKGALGSGINAKSRVLVDGVLYEVFGEPRLYYRRARLDHLEATLRVIEG